MAGLRFKPDVLWPTLVFLIHFESQLSAELTRRVGVSEQTFKKYSGIHRRFRR